MLMGVRPVLVCGRAGIVSGQKGVAVEQLVSRGLTNHTICGLSRSAFGRLVRHNQPSKGLPIPTDPIPSHAIPSQAAWTEGG